LDLNKFVLYISHAGKKIIYLIIFLYRIGGNLFSSVVSPSTDSVGASTAICGMLTGMLGLIIINWNAFNGNP
jgi:hypothetical protein